MKHNLPSNKTFSWQAQETRKTKMAKWKRRQNKEIIIPFRCIIIPIWITIIIIAKLTSQLFNLFRLSKSLTKITSITKIKLPKREKKNLKSKQAANFSKKCRYIKLKIIIIKWVHMIYHLLFIAHLNQYHQIISSNSLHKEISLMKMITILLNNWTKCNQRNIKD